LNLFARWQHMAASGGLSYRRRYTCFNYTYLEVRG